MTGFTAINAARPAIPESLNDASIPRDTAYTSLPTSIASQYLGRGDPTGTEAPVKQTSGVLRGAGAKKAGGRGKKRGSTAENQQAAKRRKNSDITDGMPVTKSKAQARKASNSKSTPQNEQSQTAEAHADEPAGLVGKTAERADPSSELIFGTIATEDSTSSVSVFAPSTSMNTLQATSLATSLDAFKASSGHVTTLYSGGQTTTQPASVQYTQPWLNQHSVSAESNHTASTTRSLRPRKQGSARPAGFLPTDQVISEPETAAARPKSSNPRYQSTAIGEDTTLQNQKDTDRPPKLRNGKSRLPSSNNNSLLGNEEGLSGLVNLADAAEANASSSRKKAASSKRKSQLPTPMNSDALTNTESNGPPTIKRKIAESLASDDEFLVIEDDDKAEIVDLTEAAEEEAVAQRPPTPPPRSRKSNIREVDADEDYGGGLLTDAERAILEQLRAAKADTTKPIVRAPFPTPILDRSPIFGAANTTLLRTCFRVGEALNVGSQAVRNNKTCILELYARVSSSWRAGRKQHFLFKDLYHDRPPHLEGTFELWEQSRLWELDSKTFLTPRDGGMMARTIANMKRQEGKWRLEVLSIWEAEWEDVEFVAGIHAKRRRFEDVNDD